MRAGIKGYITNLDIPAQQVIDYYHQLYQVEVFPYSKVRSEGEAYLPPQA